MIDDFKAKLIDEDLLNAPKILRTHCYAQTANVYEIECFLCGSHNIEWSEYEGHIWCYDCKKDVFTPSWYAGIFSGPIPVQVAHLMGLTFDRIDLKTNEIVKEPDIILNRTNEPEYVKQNEVYLSTWVRDENLYNYEQMIMKKIKGN